MANIFAHKNQEMLSPLLPIIVFFVEKEDSTSLTTYVSHS